MSSREYWFNGTGVELLYFEGFCNPTQYEQLVDDVRSYELKLPYPLDSFKDDDNEGAIVVHAYTISALSDKEQLKNLQFYTAEELAAMIFDALNEANYLNKEAYRVVEELDSLSNESFKAAFVKKIASCFSELELCHYA